MSKGIDVSVHQGDIDWKKVKADSVEFAVLRAGYGREVSQKDEQFEKNYAGCKANSIPVGAYWYSYALSVDEAKREAAACLKAIENKAFEYPIYFDIENKAQIITHTVVKNDSLWAIADKYLGNGSRYPELKALNDLRSDTIHPGQILKIPQK